MSSVISTPHSLESCVTNTRWTIRRKVALVSLNILYFVLVVTMVISYLSPQGQFYKPYSITGATIADEGYFGLWTICKEIYRGKVICGNSVTRFKLNGDWELASIAIILSTFLIVCQGGIISIQLYNFWKKKEKIIRYKKSAILRTTLILSTIACDSFATIFGRSSMEYHDEEYETKPALGYYLRWPILLISCIQFGLCMFELRHLSKDVGNPPLKSNLESTTINNPGFKDASQERVAKLFVTKESGKPNNMDGSNYGSPASSSVSISNGSGSGFSSARLPLRSSLKKPSEKFDDSANGVGIQNAGFSRMSPNSQRRSTIKKKVRIQTQSTAV